MASLPWMLPAVFGAPLHPRQEIRESVKAHLMDKTAAEARVYETQVVPFKKLKLPAISVYTLEEAVDPASAQTAPRELKRTLQLAIEGVVALSPDANVDDALDALALEIERAMHGDETLGGTASDALLASTAIEVVPDGDRPVGVVILTYTVTYYTYAPDAADVALDDFKTADIRHNASGAEARDTLNLED